MTNGEKYITADERNVALDEFCKRHNRYCPGCPICCYNGDDSECDKFKWLDLEVEEDKPMNCPFCGRNTIAVINGVKAHKGQFAVECYNREDECCYSGPFKSVRDEAISAHNRVCKAVVAYNEREVK